MEDKEITVSLNAPIKVRLTERGKELYIKCMKDIDTNGVMEKHGWISPKIDKDGYWHSQLWEFCQIFGSEMHDGNPGPVVCENLEIIIEKQ